MVALQVQDTIKKKGGKPYSLPSIAVVDVSRLGETSRLLGREGISKYQGVIDNCDLGNLRGVLLVRATLTSRVIEELLIHRLVPGLVRRLGGIAPDQAQVGAVNPKFPPSRSVGAFDQVVEPLITGFTCLRSHGLRLFHLVNAYVGSPPGGTTG